MVFVFRDRECLCDNLNPPFDCIGETMDTDTCEVERSKNFKSFENYC